MEERLLELTEKLLTYNQLCLKYYQEARETQQQQDFYKVIKPFADEVKCVKEEWQVMMNDWLKRNTSKYIHLKQIDTTSEHIERNSIQAFFPGTSKKMFLNANRTIEYFLTEVLNELSQKERDAD
ncbi:DUF1798 family protein [Neobacillus sp. Marseille-QA0830]